MKYLINGSDKEIVDFVDGTVYRFAPGKPVGVESAMVASAILSHKGRLGLVEVPSVIGENSIDFDVAGAKKAAKDIRRQGLRAIVEEYRRDQLDNRVRNNAAPLPPCQTVQDAMDELGLTAAELGINLVMPKPAAAAGDAAAVAELKAQLADMTELVKSLSGSVAYLKGKMKGGEVAPAEKTKDAATE